MTRGGSHIKMSNRPCCFRIVGVQGVMGRGIEKFEKSEIQPNNEYNNSECYNRERVIFAHWTGV